jgi:hypothetical protein
MPESKSVHDMTLAELRAAGYAVCAFNPDELNGVEPDRIEDLMCERGWDAIACLSDEDLDDEA